MSELARTLTFVSLAVLVVVVAVISSPRRNVPDIFFDVGEKFFPEFHDPEQAGTLEVVQWDANTGSAIPFAVTNRGGLWTIPSHHDYPADGAERLSNAAAEVISLIKEDFRSDNITDHEAMGVIDPLDETETRLDGRGTRITFKSSNEEILADLVVGNPIPDRPGLRFVRTPDQKRVYAARFKANISTAFEDWIETNLLEVRRDQINHIVLNNYSLNEQTQQIVSRGEFILDQISENDWTANPIPSGQEVDFVQANLLVGAILEMKIAGVRPKPSGMTGNLRDAALEGQITKSDINVLVRRGFYPTTDGGLLSNEGELLVRTTEGVLYTLRFGEIVYGRGEAVILGNKSSDEQSTEAAENRYVFITAEFDPIGLPEPPVSDINAHASWERQVRLGTETANRLATRFANWYYVIAADSYNRIHKPREDFLKEIESDR